MSSSTFEDAILRAVTPGPERLLAGVALGAAGTRGADGASESQDYLAAFGTIQLDPASPRVSTKTVMWIASCTKLPTTIAALQCVERGLFTLDDPADVDRLIPEWKDLEILAGWTDGGKPNLQPATAKITVRQLLTHTSGVGYDFMDPRLIGWRQSRGEGPLSMRTPTTEGFRTPLLFEPGSGFAYGGGLDLAGLMIARANGCTLEAYMRKNIFDVLGMDDTSFYIGHNDIGKRLMPITSRETPDGSLIDGYTEDAYLKPPLEPVDESGGAGLFGTAEDFLKLLKSILRNDARLLKPTSIDLMFTPSITPSAQNSLDVALSIPAIASIMIPGEPPLGTPDAGKWSHGLGGLLGLEGSEDGLKAGSLRWLGAPSLKWWIDREGGTCGFFATQLYPTGEAKHAFLSPLFQKDVVSRFGRAKV
ncbi:beta-lactamase/transpeptidase-like protein [Pyrenochaeta sp. MPI-SDFR-AT-0127]|nr:beta-lactamase/transpeptidase-like protein [Pyrenochaeta sp. MPI-SDFR-AT-0127]